MRRLSLISSLYLRIQNDELSVGTNEFSLLTFRSELHYKLFEQLSSYPPSQPPKPLLVVSSRVSLSLPDRSSCSLIG